MLQRKKILSLVIKLVVGLGSLAVIWYRLKSDLTPDKLSLLFSSATSAAGIAAFTFCLFLIPVNWGIESYKWKLITAPIEKISYKKATQSVYSGVCVGNLAPGRATEFLGKIIFFLPENRAQITVIHFLNGMFQLSVTILTGLSALVIQLNSFAGEYSIIAWAAGSISVLLLLIFIFCLYKIDWILNLVSARLGKENHVADFKYQLGHGLILRVFGLSVFRFAVFFCQMLLLMYLFHPDLLSVHLLISVALYFLLTTVIPMFSLLEGAIRAAIALVVFRDSGMAAPALALSSVLLWMVNIIIPSIYGYMILLKQNFNFRMVKPK